MADGGDDVFVYMGGEQVVPQNVTRVIIDRSVKIIPARAFYRRGQLVSVESHEGIERIEDRAFCSCTSLREIKKLLGVREVGRAAFACCVSLLYVEFGDKLERIGSGAFGYCVSLQKITMPSIRTIEVKAFEGCAALSDVEFGCNLETVQQHAFYTCPNLRRIAIPLKDNIFPLDPTNQQYSYDQFDQHFNLTNVDLVGGIHKTISSLLLESWRTEMKQEINRINQNLPSTSARGKTDTMRTWIRTVIDRMEHYKAEHYRLLKDDMTLLELAVWKAKIDEKNDDNSNQKVQAKRSKIDVESARKERRIKSGADIIIRNVLPFLQLIEEEE